MFSAGLAFQPFGGLPAQLVRADGWAGDDRPSDAQLRRGRVRVARVRGVRRQAHVPLTHPSLNGLRSVSDVACRFTFPQVKDPIRPKALRSDREPALLRPDVPTGPARDASPPAWCPRAGRPSIAQLGPVRRDAHARHAAACASVSFRTAGLKKTAMSLRAISTKSKIRKVTGNQIHRRAPAFPYPQAHSARRS